MNLNEGSIVDKRAVALTIDKEFKALCWPLAKSEYANLSIILREEGCQNPIAYWSNGGNMVLDGHNRLEICQEHQIPYSTRGIVLRDRDAAICWILRNQLGRRNVSETQRHSLLAELVKRMDKLRTEGTPPATVDCEEEPASEQAPEPPKGRLTAEVAQVAGVSESTVKRAVKTSRALDILKQKAPGIAQEALAGTLETKHVQKLAVLAPDQLQPMEGLVGRELKQKVSETLQGRTKKEPAVIVPLDELRSCIGKAIRKNTEAEHLLGGKPHWEEVKFHFAACLKEIDEWEQEVRDSSMDPLDETKLYKGHKK